MKRQGSKAESASEVIWKASMVCLCVCVFKHSNQSECGCLLRRFHRTVSTLGRARPASLHCTFTFDCSRLKQLARFWHSTINAVTTHSSSTFSSTRKREAKWTRAEAAFHLSAASQSRWREKRVSVIEKWHRRGHLHSNPSSFTFCCSKASQTICSWWAKSEPVKTRTCLCERARAKDAKSLWHSSR